MPIEILIIIPCFNEQTSLPSLLTALNNTKIVGDYHLVAAVVNDCSTDDTAAVARQYQAEVINLPINLGIGGAVQSGLLFARRNNYDLAVQMDGDGQHPPAELQKLLNCYQSSGANVVIGSRFIEKKGFQSSFTRRLGIGYFRWLNKIFTRQSIYDSTSGYRLFDKKAIELASMHYPDEYPEPESLVFFSRAGFIVKETAVLMSERMGGQSSIGNFASLYYCVKVTIAMIFSSIRKI